MKKLLTHTLLLLLISCTKQTVIVSDVPIVSEKVSRVEIHVAILNFKGNKNFGDKNYTIRLQDGFNNADSTLIVNQLYADNYQANHDSANALVLNTDSYSFDTAFYGTKGNLIIEIPVSMFGLVDTIGVAAKVERWCNNGYAHWTHKEFDTPYDKEKLIYPNLP